MHFPCTADSLGSSVNFKGYIWTTDIQYDRSVSCRDVITLDSVNFEGLLKIREYIGFCHNNAL
jgi:hypothetical protein